MPVIRKVLILLALAAAVLPLTSTAQETTPAAPYFTTIDSAVAAAGAREYLVLDFYSNT